MIAPLARAAAGIVLASLLLAGAALDTRSRVEAEHEELRAQIAAAQTAVSAARTAATELDTVVADLHVERAVLARVAEARTPFLDDIAAFAEQLARAEGKVDAAEARARVLAAQDLVVAERADAGVVEAAAAAVAAETAALSSRLDEYDAERAQLAAAPSGGMPTSGGEGYATVRAALDAVGGGDVPLSESATACGLGCASSRGGITFRPSLAHESWSKILWVMSHELAHVYQFRVWPALQVSPAYASLYGGDIEHLANCMATARGFAAVSCSSEQLGFAAGLWSGQVG